MKLTTDTAIYIAIEKRGPGDYVVKCEACGKRDELKPISLQGAKQVAGAHRVEHQVFEAQR